MQPVIFVNEIVSRHGAPRELLSDQGATLTSKIIQSVYEYFSTHKIQTSPYNPKCDGLTERFNKTLATMLAAYSGKTNYYSFRENIRTQTNIESLSTK